MSALGRLQASRLTSIWFENLPVEELPYLSAKNLPNLRILRLARLHKLKSLAFLVGLSEVLDELALIELKVEDISQLVALHNLRDLALSNMSIRNIEPLAGLRGLRRLRLRNTGVTDLSAVRGLSGLHYKVEGSPAGVGLPDGWLIME